VTETALAQGMAVLFTMWPHRATDRETVAAQTALYREALGELSDAAWLGACKAAIRSCEFFPMPVVLEKLAEDVAETTMRERLTTSDQARIAAADQHGQRLLTAGVVTEETAAERRERFAAMAAETVTAIREAGERAAKRDYWTGEKRRRRKAVVSPLRPLEGA
jgi:hypothetical protein